METLDASSSLSPNATNGPEVTGGTVREDIAKCVKNVSILNDFSYFTIFFSIFKNVIIYILENCTK